jgi:hypothetical protein
MLTNMISDDKSIKVHFPAMLKTLEDILFVEGIKKKKSKSSLSSSSSSVGVSSSTKLTLSTSSSSSSALSPKSAGIVTSDDDEDDADDKDVHDNDGEKGRHRRHERLALFRNQKLSSSLSLQREKDLLFIRSKISKNKSNREKRYLKYLRTIIAGGKLSADVDDAINVHEMENENRKRQLYWKWIKSVFLPNQKNIAK